MFLKIILARHTASQVLRSTPLTPPNHSTPPPLHLTLFNPHPPHVYSSQETSHRYHLCTVQVKTTHEARHLRVKKKDIFIYTQQFVFSLSFEDSVDSTYLCFRILLHDTYFSRNDGRHCWIDSVPGRAGGVCLYF